MHISEPSLHFSLVKGHLDIRNLDIVAIHVVDDNLEDDLLLMVGDLLLRDGLDQLAELHRQLILDLGLRHERRVKEAHARAKHGNSETLLVKVIDEFLKRHVRELESVPDLVEGDLAIGSLVHDLAALDRLAEAEEGQREVDEAVSVVLKLRPAVDDLVKLEDDETRHQRGGRGDGGDNLSGDELGLVPVRLLDLVVLGAEVTAGSDEIDMVVRIIVLLELDRHQLEARELARGRDGRDDLLYFTLVIKTALGAWVLNKLVSIQRQLVIREKRKTVRDLQVRCRSPGS